MLKNQKIENLFDEIIFSAEYKMSKPDPKIYHLALSLGKIKASEAIFIDDKQENIDAAKKIGIKSFLFKDNKTLKKDLEFLI
jgi:HAD superfamily hydrolase (TIGR01509 family)